MEQRRLKEGRGSQEKRGKGSVWEETDEKSMQLGLETPECESKEKGGEKSKLHKQREKKEEPGFTPEPKEEEEEEEEDGLIFLPVSLNLDNLRDWAVPGSEGDKGALVDVNNRKVILILNLLDLTKYL